jgi:hypothetical protein
VGVVNWLKITGLKFEDVCDVSGPVFAKGKAIRNWKSACSLGASFKCKVPPTRPDPRPLSVHDDNLHRRTTLFRSLIKEYAIGIE